LTCRDNYASSEFAERRQVSNRVSTLHTVLPAPTAHKAVTPLNKVVGKIGR
jgi:hypothetical protein